MRSLILFLLIALAGANATAQSAGPALWEVGEGDATLLIMGSVHVFRPDTHWLEPEMRSRFEASSILVIEVADLEDVDELTIRLVQERGFYPPGESLADEVGVELYERVMRHAEALGCGRREFSQLRPWLAVLVLTQLWAECHGYDAGAGVDVVFNRMAHAAGKPVWGLETIEEQMDVLIEGLGSDPETMLEHALVQLNNGDYLDALVEAWLKGDMPALEALLHESLADFPEIHELLIVARNRRWAGMIERMLGDEHSQFVVVGVAHLVGPDNLLDLLRARGIRVVRQ
ncbi:TraB/GumN family protein [Thioalkalivibrio sulfidiphilus]|uniref:TraB/GumN family protein n=1 Tax=Thioalkalivibrio sulfidiphilus TaxID=1033854 RepID=UPI003B2D5B3C